MTMKAKEALAYHAQHPKGKLGIRPTKPLNNSQDLALAYTPGVAAVCNAIAQDKQNVYTYTGKGNLVGVITNGSAVLGLGNIGPLAAKPIMEGKAVLMKKLAGIDAFDIELDEADPQALIKMITALSPTFGGILLEDIKAPTCFAVERGLTKTLDIPCFHDDQHGTAIVIAAALKNALKLVQKQFSTLRIIIHGAGAGAIATAKLLHTMGLPKSHIIMFDSKGIIHQDRANLSPEKRLFATTLPHTDLATALKDADCFIGLSVGNILKPAHLLQMAPKPIVFALANPTPEIDYELAKATREDILISTGRSDYPNQVNNLTGFPYIFRGLLDVQATHFNDTIKLAAVDAIASLVHTPTDNGSPLFGPDYFTPSALDKRLLTSVAPAVARAAMQTQSAQKPIQDWDHYLQHLRLVTNF